MKKQITALALAAMMAAASLAGCSSKPAETSAPETEAAEEETEEEESPEEKEEREAKEDPELAEVDVKLLTDQKLSYITPGDGVQEAQAYMTYLVQEKGFKIMTYPEGSEGEIPKEAPQPTPEAKEDDKEEKEDKEEKNRNKEVCGTFI